MNCDIPNKLRYCCLTFFDSGLKRRGALVFLIGFWVQSNGQTLNEYLEIAQKNNSGLQALRYDYEVAQEKINEAWNLPDTDLGAGYFVREPETRTGAQRATFFARQRLPWFGMLKAKKRAAYVRSELHGNTLEVAERKVVLAVKENYYRLYAARAKNIILERKKTVLKNYYEIALSALENNRASAIDVLKITMAQNELANREERLKGEALNAEVALHNIMNTDGFEALATPENLTITEEEPTMAMDEVSYHPEVLAYDHLDSLVQQQSQINARDRMPSLGVGLEYIIVSERAALEVEDNGKDIIMPTVAMAIPIFSKRHTSKIKQYALQQKSLLHQRDQKQNELEIALEQALNNKITARINYDTQLKNIAQASKAEEVLLATYQTGKVDFGELLEIQQLLLDFELQKVAAVTNYFMQTALLNYMM